MHANDTGTSARTSTQSDHTTFPTTEERIDWNLLAEIFPALVNALAWLVWAGFLLLPTLFGLHHVDLFSTANNAVFTAMGFILCLTVGVAIRSEHGGRAVLFVSGLALLAYWF